VEPLECSVVQITHSCSQSQEKQCILAASWATLPVLFSPPVCIFLTDSLFVVNKNNMGQMQEGDAFEILESFRGVIRSRGDCFLPVHFMLT
jgi:hypothetical protein